MLTRTFVHIPGVGQVTERRLWEYGVGTWEQALALSGPPGGFSHERWELARRTLSDSVASLAAHDHRYFARLLRSRDHWRTFPEFRRRAAYLDIETDGMSVAHGLTVVGLYDGVRTRSYVAGDNLAEFAEDVGRYGLLVTFNGSSFDLPFLRRRFGPIFDQLHIDLRHVLAGLGYRGGLKHVERELGLAREDDIAGLGGEDAVRLWQEYRQGSTEALELLLAYNRADVENLEPLMGMAYEEAWRRTQRC